MNLPIWMFIFVLSNRWRSGLGSTRSWLQSTQYALMCRTWLKGWLWWVLWWILQLSSYLCPRDCEFVWNICFQEVYTSFFCDTTAVSIFTNLLIVDNSYLSSFSPQLCKSFEMLLLIVHLCSIWVTESLFRFVLPICYTSWRNWLTLPAVKMCSFSYCSQ